MLIYAFCNVHILKIRLRTARLVYPVITDGGKLLHPCHFVCRLAASFSACCSAGYAYLRFDYIWIYSWLWMYSDDRMRSFKRCYSYQSCRHWPIFNLIYSLRRAQVHYGPMNTIQIQSFDLGQTGNWLLLLSNIVEQCMVVASNGTCHGHDQWEEQTLFTKHIW